MAIYWMRTADVYPDGGYSPNFFMAFDPEVRFPRFDMETGDETIQYRCRGLAMAAQPTGPKPVEAPQLVA
jgi:hypothetical protein